MRTSDRRCDVCGDRACPELTSAHFARVIWLCQSHGKAFYTSLNFFAARAARSSVKVQKHLDGWLARARADVFSGRRLAA